MNPSVNPFSRSPFSFHGIESFSCLHFSLALPTTHYPLSTTHFLLLTSFKFPVPASIPFPFSYFELSLDSYVPFLVSSRVTRRPNLVLAPPFSGLRRPVPSRIALHNSRACPELRGTTLALTLHSCKKSSSVTPFLATLTDTVAPKPFPCHSYENTGVASFKSSVFRSSLHTRPLHFHLSPLSSIQCELFSHFSLHQNAATPVKSIGSELFAKQRRGSHPSSQKPLPFFVRPCCFSAEICLATRSGTKLLSGTANPGCRLSPFTNH